jgi:hypothetical protein
MRGDDFPLQWRGFVAAAGSVVFTIICLSAGFAPSAQALPSFARQTGQPCGACHTDFPALTPYGRRFKLLGYTTGGGQFRTTPFPVFPGASDLQSQDDKMRAYAKALDGGADDNKDYVPPISMMAVVGFTHTQAPLPPGTAPYAQNDNTVLSPFSGFWGGAITNNIGAFAQVTYNAPPPGGFSDPLGHTWTWDNTDVRYASTAHAGPFDVIYGITANNNPTVQDVWNTTPAWAFPYAVSTIASTPAAKTQIEGAFAARVVGVGAYMFINDMLYLEMTGYRTLDFRTQNSLGVDPFGAGQYDGISPYWRVALEPQWGPHSLMVGTFGMYSAVKPLDPLSGALQTIPQSDKFTDVGFDAQYQYQGSNYWLTLRGSYIHEYQKLDATFAAFNALGVSGASNPSNFLNSLHLQASFAYGADNRFVLTGQYFDISGSSDLGLYGGNNPIGSPSPNSNGFIGELAYIPFGASQAPGWPWLNARLALQYTYYNKFNGTTVGAHDNNTLFLHAWFAM